MSDNHDSPADAVHPIPPPTLSSAGILPANSATTDAQAGPSNPMAGLTMSSNPNNTLGNASIHLNSATLNPPQASSSVPHAPSPAAQEEVVIDPALLAVDQAAANAAAQESADAYLNFDLDEEGFDPATLANLAALSRIAHEEEDEGLDNQEEDDQPRASGLGENEASQDIHGQGQGEGEGEEEVELSGEQMNAIVQGLKDAKVKKKRGPKGKRARSTSTPADKGSGADEGHTGGEEDEEESDMEGKDDKDGKYYYDNNGKLKRKRNRTVLMSSQKTYVPRPSSSLCDTNARPLIIQNTIRRGVAAMCKMEAPIMPERKRRKPLEESPINYELGLRVSALETLIRAGTSMDADSANSAAMETILQATKAAGTGNVEAGNALASLSSAAGMDLSELESGERAGLLMEVLQQLSDASMPPRVQINPQAQSTTINDPWSAIPRARSNLLSHQRIDSAYESDAEHPRLDLTLHGFREDNGKIFIPPTVRYVEKLMRADKESMLAKDALPIEGDERFLREGTRLVYGAESNVWKKNFVSAVQTHTITGGLRVAGSFLSRFLSYGGVSSPRAVYCPSPTTVEDETALRESGLEVRRFRFLDTETGVVDWEGVRQDLQEATPKSVVLLYVSGTVPTGMELAASQWRILTTLLLERQLLALCVLPFQGLSSGDVDRDAQPVKFMVHEGLPTVVVQSFDAAMGIYADSPSIVSIATQSVETKDRVDSQLRAAARTFHSHPAPWGAHIVWSILSDAKLYPAWLTEMKAMAGRLRSVREKLFDVLTNKLKTPGSWGHIKRSSGMMCTSLLPQSQVTALALSRNIHLNPDGSFSLGALNAARIEALARGIDQTVRDSIREQEEAQAAAIALELALAAAREAAAKEEAEAAERAARDAEEKAREEDTLLMEASIADAMEQQRREEEEEKRREEERREMDEAIRKAAERAEMQRKAEAILASIGAM